MTAAKDRHGKAAHGLKHPYFGCHLWNLTALEVDCLRSFIDNILPMEAGARVRGFKEVRHMSFHMTDVEFDGYTTFLMESFPNSRIVFNRRNAVDVSRSRFWPKKFRRDVVKRVRNADERFARFMASPHAGRAFCVDYEDYTRDANSLVPLFEFLGETFDVERVKEVLNTRFGH